MTDTRRRWLTSLPLVAVLVGAIAISVVHVGIAWTFVSLGGGVLVVMLTALVFRRLGQHRVEGWALVSTTTIQTAGGVSRGRLYLGCGELKWEPIRKQRTPAPELSVPMAEMGPA